MSYSNGMQQTITLPAVDLTGAAAVDFKAAGPKGKTGRLVGIQAVYTTGVTVAASQITVGVSGDTDKYGYLDCPIAAADSVYNDYVDGVDERIDEDAVLEIGNAGGATAGVADVTVTIEWS